MSVTSCFNIGRISAALALGATLILAGPSAQAQPSGELLNDVSVNGTATDTVSSVVSNVTGQLDITGITYDAASGLLEVVGTITGSAIGDGVTTDIVSQIFRTTATLENAGDNGKKCQILNLDLGPLNLDLLGLVVDLSEVELDLTAVRGPGKLLGNLLCGLTGLLDGGALDSITRQLDRINSLLGGLLENINVESPLPDNGTFTGFLNLDSIGVDQAGNLVFTGVLNGLVTQNGVVTPIVNQAINTPGTLTGTGGGGKGKKCGILSLDLGPLDLDVLGLQVDLSEVLLDISGEKGPGKLLGNLLCGLTKALDGNNTNPDKQAKKLLKSVQKINNLLQ